MVRYFSLYYYYYYCYYYFFLINGNFNQIKLKKAVNYTGINNGPGVRESWMSSVVYKINVSPTLTQVPCHWNISLICQTYEIPNLTVFFSIQNFLTHYLRGPHYYLLVFFLFFSILNYYYLIRKVNQIYNNLWYLEYKLKHK